MYKYYRYFPQVEIEKGKTINIKTLALGDLDANKGTREVFFEVNGYMRTIFVEDKAKSSVSLCPMQFCVLLTIMLIKLYGHWCCKRKYPSYTVCRRPL